MPPCVEDEECLFSCASIEDCLPKQECLEGWCSPDGRCRAMVCVPGRPCNDDIPEIDRLECRGVRETCLTGFCECGADCNLDGIVFGNEISIAVNVLGDPGTTPLSECPAADIEFPLDGEVMANEITLAVMNLGLYDPVNTRYLAQKDWMMTCTDGRDPGPARAVTHPRVFGAFTKKIKDFVIDEGIVTMPFAVRSMTGLAAASSISRCKASSSLRPSTSSKRPVVAMWLRRKNSAASRSATSSSSN